MSDLPVSEAWDRNVTKRERKQPILKEQTFELYERQRIKLGNEISNRIRHIEKMIESRTSYSLVNNEILFLNNAFAELLLVCEKERPMIDNHIEFDLWVEEIDTDVLFIKNSAIRYVRENEIRASSHSGSNPSKSSKSLKSSSNHSSSSSKASEKLLKESAELATLEVELAFADRKGISESERVILEEKIAKKKALLGVYQNWNSDLSLSEVASSKISVTSAIKRKPLPKSESTRLKFLPTPPSRPKTRAVRNFSVNSPNIVNSELSNAICDLVKIQGAPSVELDVFSGNPLDFKFFLTNFEDLVEKRISDSAGRLARLLNFTSGDANDLIQCCLYRKDGYQYAKSLLTKKYGDPHRIMIAYKKQLDNWESVKLGDSSAFGKFHSFLLKCGSVIEGKLWNSFDTADNLCIIASKLPPPCQDKWNRRVIDIRSRFEREPSFKDLLSFVENEMIVASDPLFSKEALKERFPPDSKISSSGFKPRKFYRGERGPKSFLLCVSCNVKHDIEACPIFRSKTLEEKSKFLMKERLCYGCLGKGHISANCRNRRTCTVCNKRHPTSLHGLKVERRPPVTDSEVRSVPERTRAEPKTDKKSDSKVVNGPPVTSCYSNDSEGNISMCVVPVVLRHENSRSDIVTFALLDSCSQATFISEEILSSLSLQTETTDLTINTITSSKTEKCRVASGLKVKGFHSGSGSWISLPKSYSKFSIPVDPSEIPTVDSIKGWPYLKSIESELPIDTSLKVGLLIGANCPKALEPLKTISSQGDGPFAFKTKLGWCVVGPIRSSRSKTVSCCRIMTNSHGNSNHLVVEEPQIKDSGIEVMLRSLFEIDCVPETKLSKEFESFSQDDLHFLEIVENHSKFIDGHYHIPLPFRNKNISFPNNLSLAMRRLNSLKKKFESSSVFHSDYVTFMNKIIDRGWASEVSCSYPDGQNWFLPHHGVYHPTKNKIRVVFDCSSSFKGFCMNKELMQGPDLTNHLLGVLIRFREEFVAFSADIESMFFQIRIPSEQRRFHQFLWWRDGDFTKPPVRYEMNAHLQGSTSSPSCSNFALKLTASDGEKEFGTKAADTLRRNFYVDDLLKSSHSVESASSLISDVSKLCDSRGFHLTKFISNFPQALESVPADERKEVKSESERVLGVLWSVKEDVFHFKAPSKVFSRSRRGMLSALNSIYDPLGLISPFILKGRLIFQKVCQLSIGWDDPVPNNFLIEWDKWVESLVNLQVFQVSRCFKPRNFSRVIEISLHHFSDACDYGYGGCHYLRFVTSGNVVHCSLVMGKSRVVPAKSNLTTPRLELVAATLSSQISSFISKEFDYAIDYEMFWCDNTCALGYISNSTKRFRKFVANRVSNITKTSKPDQWHYVESENNPADHGSRGLKVVGNDKKVSEWFDGPSFLWEHPLNFEESAKFDVSDSDPEVVVDAKTSVMVVKSHYTDIVSYLENISCFSKMKKIISYVLLFIQKCRKKNRVPFRKTRSQPEFDFSTLLSVEILSKASFAIFKLVQTKYFSSTSDSKLSSLNVFLDDNGLIRVGGRLKRSLLDSSVKYPIVVPKHSEIAKSIVRFYHDKVFHSGRNITMNEIRENGIWIINLCSIVKSVIWNCFLCRMLRGKFGNQFMSDLPFERTLEAPPFSFCGVDLFGPFLVKERRALVKRWGVIYTCLSSRAVHLESVFTMDTDSFILCLRRFVCRRGSVRMIKSYNGSNFVGTKNELKDLFRSLDHKKIRAFLRDEFNADYIVWERKPPYSSHFGGVWERQIRSVRGVLNGMLLTHSRSLNDESFRTMLCEVECILNSRPLSVENIGDPLSLKPITPMMLLTGKSKIVLAPPGAFGEPAAYSRRQWVRVQHLINEFWSRWKKEYLANLQQRSKWLCKKRNFKVGDVVLVKTEEKRNLWPIGRVIKAPVDENGHCRKVTIKTVSGNFERPISNIVLLEEVDSLPKSHQDMKS